MSMLGLLVAIAGCAYTDPYADADPRHTPKKGATSCVTEKKNPTDNYELKFKCTLEDPLSSGFPEKYAIASFSY
jgi:hypothetical protein